jgi:hypothetical protein
VKVKFSMNEGESETQVRLVEGIGIDVLQAEHTGAHQLRLVFSDGTERIVDFGPFLDSSAHPAIRSFLEPNKFASFLVEQGDLLWGDYDLCFQVADLYEGRV